MKIGSLPVWFRISLLNLAIVALYGTVMRYKIAFDFPFFEQKNLLHAHSHFAFSGWISHLLYSVLALQISNPAARSRKYPLLLAMNLLSAYGMLISFTIQGYGLVSISFSTFTILISILFTVFFIRDTRSSSFRQPARKWAVAGLLLQIVSAAGPFVLAWMMATKNIHHEWYLASVYYYLHFQYNGWFFFGAMAIIVSYLPPEAGSLKKYFYLFLATVFPAFFLSVLWAKPPLWLYIITVLAAFLQLFSWVGLLYRLTSFYLNSIRKTSLGIRIFIYASATAVTLKFILQAISVIPSLSQLVFGIRPIVIAYLHLVLLGGYTLFFFWYLFDRGFLQSTRRAMISAVCFFIGVLLNELLLGIQGFAAFYYFPIPYIQEALFLTGVLLFCSASGLCLSGLYQKNIVQKNLSATRP